MFVGILMGNSERNFDVEFESSRHREILEISLRARSKNYREPSYSASSVCLRHRHLLKSSSFEPSLHLEKDDAPTLQTGELD